MKFFLGILLISMGMFWGCDNLDESIATQELQQAEHSRAIHPGKLARWLNHDRPHIRLKAVETLGKIQDTSSVVLFVNRLKDEDPQVRRAAVFGLGQLFDPRAEEPLLTRLRVETDKAVRLAIIDALGKSGTQNGAAALKDFLESQDPDYRQAAAMALANLAFRGFFPQDLSDTLGRLVKSDNPQTAWRSAYAIYRLGALRFFEDVRESLNSPAPLVRYYGLKNLERVAFLIQTPPFSELKQQPRYRDLAATVRSRDFRNQLTAQLEDSTWYVRFAALEALKMLGDANTQSDIAGRLDDPHPYVQIQAIRTMGSFKNWYTRKEMRRLYQEAPDWRVRGEALVMLALVQPREALDHVKNDLLSQPWPQNYYAIRTLDSLKTTDPKRPLREEDEATKLLVELASSPNAAQATTALEVLVGREKGPSVDFFVATLKNGDMAITTIVAKYLSIIRDPRPLQAVQPLMEVYQTFRAPVDLEAMEAIITALDSIGSQESLPFLREQLANPYPSLRQKARQAVVRLTGEETLPVTQPRDAYQTKWDFPPVSADSTYRVTFNTTAGEFTLELFPAKAPLTVANFLSLIRKRFYDNIYFHRVVPGFVIQTGDPRGDGWGGPGYSILCEYNDMPYDRGTVGMALAGKDTGSSQFFVTHLPQPHLEGRYTVFGRVVEGLEVVDRTMLFDRIVDTELSVLPKAN